MSGEASVETFKGNRQRIVVTQLPYLVVKQTFVEKLAELVEDAKIDGIADIRDESSDKVGIRVAIDLRKDVDPAVVLNHLREKTDFVRNFNVNMTCLDSRGRPRQMGLLQILGEFVQFRREVVRRRTLHRLEKARTDLHRQIGLYAATLRIDEVVATIRASSDPDVARAALLRMEFATQGGFAQLLSEVDPDVEIGEGLFGLPEPVGDVLGPIAVNDVDLLVIPAAAVDRHGMRLGWGRGYFDKTLGSMEKCPPVYAVIFDSELVDEVPRDVHDQPVSGVVTPTRTVPLGASAS